MRCKFEQIFTVVDHHKFIKRIHVGFGLVFVCLFVMLSNL